MNSSLERNWRNSSNGKGFAVLSVCGMRTFFRESEIFLESVAKQSSYLLLRTIFAVKFQSESIST